MRVPSQGKPSQLVNAGVASLVLAGLLGYRLLTIQS